MGGRGGGVWWGMPNPPPVCACMLLLYQIETLKATNGPPRSPESTQLAPIHANQTKECPLATPHAKMGYSSEFRVLSLICLRNHQKVCEKSPLCGQFVIPCPGGSRRTPLIQKVHPVFAIWLANWPFLDLVCFRHPPETSKILGFAINNDHLSKSLSPPELAPSPSSKVGRLRFRGVRLQTPSSVRFLALTEFWGENSVSSSRPTICVLKQTHRVSRRTHRVCRRTR